jgi:polyhydroxyalkanoate synthesis regulator phasin
MSITADINKDGKWYFSKLVTHLEKKGQLTCEQKDSLIEDLKSDTSHMITEEGRKRSLFQMLSDNGYTHVRYYESLKQYISNPDETLKTEMTHKLDIKSKLKYS